MSFLVLPLIPPKTPTCFPIVCPPPLVSSCFGCSTFADLFSIQRQVFEPRSTGYSLCQACSVSPVVSTLQDPLSQPISIVITLRLAVTKKDVMPSTICNLGTPSWIPLECLKSTTSPLSTTYKFGIKCQYGNTRVIAFTHLIPLP